MDLVPGGFRSRSTSDSPSYPRREYGSEQANQLENAAAVSSFSVPKEPAAERQKKNQAYLTQAENFLSMSYQEKGEVAKSYAQQALDELDKIPETEEEFAAIKRLNEGKSNLRLVQGPVNSEVAVHRAKLALRSLEQMPETGDLVPDKLLFCAKCHLELSYKEKNPQEADVHAQQSLAFATAIPNEERYRRIKPTHLARIYLRLSYSQTSDSAMKAENAAQGRKYAEAAGDAELIKKTADRSRVLENGLGGAARSTQSQSEQEHTLFVDTDPEIQARDYLKLSKTSSIDKAAPFAEKAVRAAEKIEPKTYVDQRTKAFLISSSYIQWASSLRPLSTSAGDRAARDQAIDLGKKAIGIGKQAEQDFGKDEEFLKIQARGHEFCAHILDSWGAEVRSDRVYHAKEELTIGRKLGNLDIQASALCHLSSAEMDGEQKKIWATEAEKCAANTEDQSLKNRVALQKQFVFDFYGSDTEAEMVRKSDFGGPDLRYPPSGYAPLQSTSAAQFGSLQRQPQLPPAPQMFGGSSYGSPGPSSMAPGIRRPDYASPAFAPSPLQPMRQRPFTRPPNITNVSQSSDYGRGRGQQLPGYARGAGPRTMGEDNRRRS